MGEDFRFCPRCGGAVALKNLKQGEPLRPVCISCKTVHFLAPKLAAGVVLLHENKLVLTRRAIDPGCGLWTYPGGFVELGETVAEAAVREAREEAHAEVELVDLLGVYSYPHSKVVIVVFKALSIGALPKPGDEVEEIGLFGTPEIPWETLAFRSVRDALKDFVA